MQNQILFDTTKTDTNKDYFLYNNCKFKPFRKFNSKEANCWLEFAKYFEGDIFTDKNWNYDLFYQQAGTINASEIDVFEMESEAGRCLVVPTSWVLKKIHFKK